MRNLSTMVAVAQEQEIPNDAGLACLFVMGLLALAWRLSPEVRVNIKDMIGIACTLVALAVIGYAFFLATAPD